MSDSECSEENYGYYGKPLEPYDEDAFPKKKPISVEEQTATDEKGRRRFHGAFTGGFSAGFYNTVGSLEGWRPSEFKSSRSEKNEVKTRKPEDYMDDEDMGEFGIAPHTVQAKDGFNTKKKRKKETHSDGPIPGTPVLETLLEAGNETIGYLLLRNMGFKQAEMDEHSDEDIEMVPEEGAKIYGCEIPKTYAIKKSFDNKKYEVPKIYGELLQKPKDNSFGLGYTGLDKSHINLFLPQKSRPQNLVIAGKSKNTSLKIQGQAFGVGAFEEDDDDIYVRDDMSSYDFELTAEANKASSSNKPTEKLVYDMFMLSTDTLTAGESFPPPTIPHSFTGKYKKKKSRFELAGTEESSENRSLNAEMRARYLGVDVEEGKTYTPSNWQQGNKGKHELERNRRNDEQKLKKSDDFSEKQRISLDVGAQGLLFDRFVSASAKEDPSAILEPVARSEVEHGTLQMREAARMKMFGPLTRETITWQPCALLCKRFNLPEPLSSEFGSKHERKRTKNLIFEFQKFDDVSPDLQPGLSINLKNNATEPTEIKEEISEETDNTDKTRITDITTQSDSSNNSTMSISFNVNAALTSSENIAGSSKDTTEISSNTDTILTTPAPEAMDKINISQNQDLFRSIFADSSDDDSDNENDTSKTSAVNDATEASQRRELLKATVLSDELIPKIRPMKIGILSDINLPKITDTIIPETKNNEVIEIDKSTEGDKSVGEAPDLYGPKLPDRIIFKKPQTFKETQESCEDWIEKDVEDRNEKKDKEKYKKHKKHKKEKKHKKSKHKHKR